jgi:hypothetical protein
MAIPGEPPGFRPLLATRFVELYGIVSPDGHSIAYASDESGRLELYVRAFPSMTGQVRVSTDGVFANNAAGVGRPAWRRDGRELIYLAPDRRTVISVDVRPGPPAEFGTPHVRFKLPVDAVSLTPAPDFDRFLLSVERGSAGRVVVTLLLNWTGLVEGGG